MREVLAHPAADSQASLAVVDTDVTPGVYRIRFVDRCDHCIDGLARSRERVQFLQQGTRLGSSHASSTKGGGEEPQKRSATAVTRNSSQATPGRGMTGGVSTVDTATTSRTRCGAWMSNASTDAPQ